MASGGHRIQGEHYHNQDIHLTVACLRARKSQLSPRDAYYQQVQPERFLLNPLDRKLHGMPKCNESSPYSSKYNNVKGSIQEDKRELKRRLQQIERHEAEAEAERQKRAEKWRQLVVKEEREERERKRKIQSLQKLIERETQRAHPRYHTDVNSANTSTYLPSSNPDFKDSSKTPFCSSATNITEPEVAADVLINVQEEASHTFEQPKIMSAVAPTEQHLESCYDMEDQLLPDRKDDLSLKDADSTNNATEQTAPFSVTTNVGIAPHGETSTTVDIVKQATEVEQVADSALTEDSEVKTEYKPTDTESLADDRTYAEHLHTVSPDAEVYTNKQEWSITEPPVQDTVSALITRPAAHKSGATPTVLQLTTEPQIQHNDDAVIRLEAKEESEATPTVQTTTDVTKTQQCNCKELQTQDTEVDTAARITQPAAHKSDATLTAQITTVPQIQPPDVAVTTQPEANEGSRATLTVQIISDSDTRSESHDTQFWYHRNNTDDIYRTPESMSRVFTCRHSEYSYVILYLLLYS